MVNAGAEINAKDVYGQTALHMASILGRYEVVKVLLETNQCDINAAKEDGFCALHCAVQEGHGF